MSDFGDAATPEVVAQEEMKLYGFLAGQGPERTSSGYRLEGSEGPGPISQDEPEVAFGQCEGV